MCDPCNPAAPSHQGKWRTTSHLTNPGEMSTCGNGEKEETEVRPLLAPGHREKWGRGRDGIKGQVAMEKGQPQG